LAFDLVDKETGFNFSKYIFLRSVNIWFNDTNRSTDHIFFEVNTTFQNIIFEE